MLLSAYYMPGAVLCALFQEKEFKTCWDFSAEDKEMNEYKCTLEKFTIRIPLVTIIICGTCILIEYMIRIPPVHNSEDWQILQTGTSYVRNGRLFVTLNVRWQ